MLMSSRGIESNPRLKSWLVFCLWSLNDVCANYVVKIPLMEALIKSKNCNFIFQQRQFLVIVLLAVEISLVLSVIL